MMSRGGDAAPLGRRNSLQRQTMRGTRFALDNGRAPLYSDPLVTHNVDALGIAGLEMEAERMTACTTHFVGFGETQAIVYRHMDGGPDFHGRELAEFFAEVERQTSDTRFTDPCYLAAKFVVWLAARFARYGNGGGPLDFLSVGVVMADPGDIRFRYVVDCARPNEGRPKVEAFAVSCVFPAEDWSSERVAIPEAVGA